MNDWGFYGRKDLIGDLTQSLTSGTFHVEVYIGRRGIGKSGFVAETLRRLDADGRGKPALMFELDDGMDGNRLMSSFVDALAELELDAPLKNWDPGLAERVSPGYAVGKAVRLLVQRDWTVFIDEFQIADTSPELEGMIGQIKQLIDRQKRAGNPGPGPGKLILAGSDQQGMARLFDGDQPLHERAWPKRVPGWSVAEIFEMAQDQGWLDFPGRFLTLYAAFGNVPRYWEEFHGGERKGPAAMMRWDDDAAWRLAFAEWALSKTRDSWRDPLHAWTSGELSDDNQAVLKALARHRTGWRTAAELRGGLKFGADDAWEEDRILDSLENIRKMEIVRPSPRFLVPGEFERDEKDPMHWMDETAWPAGARWRIHDSWLRFWVTALGPAMRRADESIAVHPQTNGRPSVGSRPSADQVQALEESLKTVEGVALEELVGLALLEAWLVDPVGFSRHVGYSVHVLEGANVPEAEGALEIDHDWKVKPQPVTEIDLLGFHWTKPEAESVGIVGSCKRNPRGHDVVKHLAEPLRKMEAARANLAQEVRRGLELPLDGWLVSPAFDPTDRDRREATKPPTGIERLVCVDIPEMVRWLTPELAEKPGPSRRKSSKIDLLSDGRTASGVPPAATVAGGN